MPVHVLKSGRAALEASRGTDLTPTRLIYFDEGTHQQEVATIRPQQIRNSFFGYYSAAAGPELNTFESSGAMSYDDLIWYANTHIKAVASGSGGGSDKTWTFLPTATSDDIKSATVQLGYSDGLGSSQPAVKLNGLVGDEFSLKFDKSGDATVQFTSKMISKSAATQITAFTGSLTDRTVVLASAVNTTTYIDTTTIGSTADANVTDVTWSLKNGYNPLYTLNASAAPTDLLRTGPRTWKAEITRAYAVYTSPADAEWDAYIAKTVRKIRVKTVGPALGGSNYTITLDLYGVYTAMTNAEANGIAVQKFTLEPVYDTTATSDFVLSVVNATSSIT